MKYSILLLITLPVALAFSSCGSNENGSDPQEEVHAAEGSIIAPSNGDAPATTGAESGKPIYLNTAEFISRVHDFRTATDWKYLGDKPAIIDFYADWCQPCKMVAPFLEELAAKYEGQVYIYKVNVDKETDVAAYYQIRSIPTFFFIKADGNAGADMGYKPKEYFEQQILSMLN